MRPVRTSLISSVMRRRQDVSADEYAHAAGRSDAARHRGNAHGTSCDVGAIAPTERAGAAVPQYGLVPRLAHDSSSSDTAINNMAENPPGKSQGLWRTHTDEHRGHVQLVMTDSGEVSTVMVRRPAQNQICIIDWLNFSVSEETWCKTARQQLVTDDQFIDEASRQLEKIFGFGITEKCKGGKNFFKESWALGNNMGFVCFGGQRGKMGIILNGHGCLHAVPGWEFRLHAFLKNTSIGPKISRVDLAHDDFDGSYLSVDWADTQWDEGGFSFSKGGRPPECGHLGNWKRPSGKGRTFTVGMRSSSYYGRCYEKGKKEGDKYSNWCRFEVECKNTNMVIDLDVLLNPSTYFLGAYPCMEFLNRRDMSDERTRFEVKKRAAKINMEAAEKWLVVQCGKYFRVFREMYGDKQALDRLCCADEDYWPKRLKRLTDSAPTHKEPIPVPNFTRFITTVPSFGLNGDNGFV